MARPGQAVLAMLAWSWLAVLATCLQLDKSWLQSGRLQDGLLLQVTVPTLYQCLHLCVGRSLCRSVSFHRPSSQCQLNVQSVGSGVSLTSQADWLSLDRQHFQHEEVAGSCLNTNCGDYAFCFAADRHSSKCFPIGQPPSIITTAEDTTVALTTTSQPGTSQPATAAVQTTATQPTTTSTETTAQATTTAVLAITQQTSTSTETTAQPSSTTIATTTQPTTISTETTTQQTSTSTETTTQPTSTSTETTAQPSSTTVATTTQPTTTSTETTTQPSSTTVATTTQSTTEQRTTQPSTAATTAAYPNVNCGSPPAAPAGMTRSSSTGTRYHDTANYTCNGGTIWPNTGFLRCNESSQWQGDPGGCSYTNCYDPGLPSSYSGTLSVTSGGITCQRWDTTSPNFHGYLFSFFHKVDGSATAANNYCRAIAESQPWCYKMTNYVFSRWDYCAVPLC